MNLLVDQLDGCCDIEGNSSSAIQRAQKRQDGSVLLATHSLLGGDRGGSNATQVGDKPATAGLPSTSSTPSARTLQPSHPHFLFLPSQATLRTGGFLK